MANYEEINWFKINSNWNIAVGSFSSIISLESHFQQTLEQQNSQINNNNNNNNKLPLVLVPPSPDSDPCEITISFTENQEVQQVYVRSTARVYEIYSARSLRSSNDYLCTVRCGIATRDDEVLHATDIEPVGGHSKQSNREHEKENCSSSEDDWVEVKSLDMPLQDVKLNSVRQTNGVNPRTKLQDLYEATAQFTDSDACTSLTLRLLSLQTKDWISIDEIYIFVEPAETADSEAEVTPFGNSATNSLMSMLVPTLLQLSKSSNAQRQDLHAPSSSEKVEPEYQDIGSKDIHSTDVENKLEREIKEAGSEPPEVDISEQESVTGQRHNVVSHADVSTSRVELVLEQLVSRVSRIEDICLRFEENMLKPIKSIEQRLQMVEEQVQVLAKNSLHPKLPSYTRISAPEFSCGESNSSSFSTEGNENPSCEEVDSKKDTTSDKVSDLSSVKNYVQPKLPSYTRISAPEFTCGESNSSSFYTEGNENLSCGEVVLEKEDTMSDKVPYSSHSKFHHGLVISAPEFTFHDDEENTDGDAKEANDDAIGSDTDCPQEKPRQALSIDDALAAALSGFMANTSAQPARYTEVLTVEAPRVTTEEIGDDDMATKQNEYPLIPLIFYSKSNGTKLKDDIVSSPSEGDSGQDKLVRDSVNFSRNESELELVQTDNSHTADSAGVGDFSDETADSVSVKNDILDAVPENTEVEVGKCVLESTVKLVENDDLQTADSTVVGEPSDEATIYVLGRNTTMAESSGTMEMESGKSISENSIDSQGPYFSVDFELPILDVKFTSSEFQNAASSLDVLFDNMSDIVVDASLTDQKNEDENIDATPNCSWADDHLLFDWGHDDASIGPSSLEGKAQDYLLAHDKLDNFPSLL